MAARVAQCVVVWQHLGRSADTPTPLLLLDERPVTGQESKRADDSRNRDGAPALFQTTRLFSPPPAASGWGGAAGVGCGSSGGLFRQPPGAGQCPPAGPLPARLLYDKGRRALREIRALTEPAGSPGPPAGRLGRLLREGEPGSRLRRLLLDDGPPGPWAATVAAPTPQETGLPMTPPPGFFSQSPAEPEQEESVGRVSVVTLAMLASGMPTVLGGAQDEGAAGGSGSPPGQAGEEPGTSGPPVAVGTGERRKVAKAASGRVSFAQGPEARGPARPARTEEQWARPSAFKRRTSCLKKAAGEVDPSPGLRGRWSSPAGGGPLGGGSSFPSSPPSSFSKCQAPANSLLPGAGTSRRSEGRSVACGNDSSVFPNPASDPGFIDYPLPVRLVSPHLATVDSEEQAIGTSDMMAKAHNDILSNVMADTHDGCSSDIMVDVQDGGLSDVIVDVQDGGLSDVTVDVQDGSLSDVMVDVQDGSLSDVMVDVQDGSLSDVMVDVQDGSLSDVMVDAQDGSLSDIVADHQDGSWSDVMAVTQDGSLSDAKTDTYDDGLSIIMADHQDGSWSDVMADSRDGGLSDVMADNQDGCLSNSKAGTHDGHPSDIMADTQDTLDAGLSDVLAANQDGALSDVMANNQDGGSIDMMADAQDAGCSDLLVCSQDGGSINKMVHTQDGSCSDLLADTQDGGSSDLLADSQDGGSCHALCASSPHLSEDFSHEGFYASEESPSDFEGDADTEAQMARLGEEGEEEEEQPAGGGILLGFELLGAVEAVPGGPDEGAERGEEEEGQASGSSHAWAHGKGKAGGRAEDIQDVYTEIHEDMFSKAFLFNKFMRQGRFQCKTSNKHSEEKP